MYCIYEVIVTEEEKPRRKDWEAAVEKQIREAMERGDFANLRGVGKPLDLSENPYTPEEWRLAFKVLKDAGAAPGWIEQGKEIRNELRALSTLLNSQSRWHHERREKIKTLAPNKMIAEYENLTQAIEKTCKERLVHARRQRGRGSIWKRRFSSQRDRHRHLLPAPLP